MVNKKADIPATLIWVVLAIAVAIIIILFATKSITGQSLGGFKPSNLF